MLCKWNVQVGQGEVNRLRVETQKAKVSARCGSWIALVSGRSRIANVRLETQSFFIKVHFSYALNCANYFISGLANLPVD